MRDRPAEIKRANLHSKELKSHWCQPLALEQLLYDITDNEFERDSGTEGEKKKDKKGGKEI